MTEPRPRIGVVVFPGSNDDRDAALAVEALGGDPVLVWHAECHLPDVGAVILPGGFSYGDYLRAGAIARFAPVMEGVARFAAGGGAVLGICNGFQVLCEAGLLPGALQPNESLEFICRDVPIRVERADTTLTEQLDPGQLLTIPVKHGDGCYVRPPGLPEEQVAFRYAGPCNGSADDIAGVVNEHGNILGLMPHPEHAVDPLFGSADGAPIIAAVVEAARTRLLSPTY